MENKKQQIAKYSTIWSAKTNKQILKEIQSYHKYFAKYKSSWSDGTSNKDDFTPSDKLLELKIIAIERGI